MTWRNLVKPLSTADVAGNLVSQRFRHPDKTVVLHGIHAGLAVYNDAAFGSLSMKLFSDRAGSPGMLIASSTNSYTKAQVLTQNSALKFAGFVFNGILLQAAEWYHLLLVPSAYTGIDSSFVAWRVSYPDPQYPVLMTLNAAKGAKHHFDFSVYGYTLEESE
jgi:hypothetical protein